MWASLEGEMTLGGGLSKSIGILWWIVDCLFEGVSLGRCGKVNSCWSRVLERVAAVYLVSIYHCQKFCSEILLLNVDNSRYFRINQSTETYDANMEIRGFLSAFVVCVVLYPAIHESDATLSE